MLVTEDEARMKECRVGGQVTMLKLSEYREHEVTRLIPIGAWPHCSASDCMTGWRWGKKEKAVRSPSGTGHNMQTLPPEEWLGFCGLAGRPEE